MKFVPSVVVLFAIAIPLALAGCTMTDETVKVSDSDRAQLKSIAAVPPELDVARQYNETQCLRRAGFSVPISLTVPPANSSDNLAGVLGLFSSVAEAKSSGYTSSIRAAAAAPVDAYRESLSKSDAANFDKVRLGNQSVTQKYAMPGGGNASVSTGGCFGKSIVAVYGSPKAYLQLSTSRTVLSGASPANPSLPPGTGTYTHCMLEAGIRTTGLTQTMKVATSRFGSSRPLGSEPTAAEEAMAVSDAKCQVKAKLLEYYDDSYIKGAGAWVRANQDWIAGSSELQTSALARAKSILEDADPS